MSVQTVRTNLLALTYNTATYRVIEAKIELGDCVYAKFDERATYMTYKFVQQWATQGGEGIRSQCLQRATTNGQRWFRCLRTKRKTNTKKLEIPPYCLDLAPAFVFVTRARVKELYADFNEALSAINSSVIWPDDTSVQ